jgi:hypothetical protein
MEKYFAILKNNILVSVVVHFVYLDVGPDTTRDNVSFSLIEDISIWSYGPDLVEELLVAMSLWGQPGSKLMPPCLTQRYSWTAPHRSLWSHLITLCPWTNNKYTIPWAMAYTSVGWEWVQEGLHRSPLRNQDPDWNMEIPLCSTLVLSHSCGPHSRLQWNLVSFTIHWQISRNANS